MDIEVIQNSVIFSASGYVQAKFCVDLVNSTLVWYLLT